MEQEGATESRAGVHRRLFFRPASWARRLGWRSGDLARSLGDSLERELADRAGFQWLAVAFGAGAAVYFVLPREPLFAALVALAFVFASAAIVSYRRGASVWSVAVIAVLLAGATAAKLRVDSLDTPHVERPFAAALNGRVAARENRVELRPRIVLDRLSTDAAWAGELPKRVRITVAERYELPPLGAEVTFRGRLMPVPGPVVPGGYDPRGAAYFDGIGGSGFAFGDFTVVAPPPRFALDLMIARIRAAIVARIMAAEPAEAGAVAAALLVGERSTISTETNENLRRSGLAHILSISGLHMMLVAGTVFYFLRAVLALSPRLALGRPIRKWSAVAALVAATAYLAVSGGNVATVRAYVMAAVIFSAMLLDRPAISMRNLAIAAFIVVALRPEGVLEPGFQMSFGAVAALIAAWEAWRDRTVRRLSDDSVIPGQRVLRFVWRAFFGVALTTLVAGFATAPFAAYHFERVASYSLLGNLLAAPFVSIVIMPFGLLALVVMPFGLEALPLAVMAWGIEAMLSIAAWVSALPGAEVRAPPIAPFALLVIVAGMLWLCLWRGRWRLIGLPTIGMGLCLIPLLVDRADIMVAPEGNAVAVRDTSGVLRVSGSRAGSYTIDQFFDKEAVATPAGDELREGVRCDPSACMLGAAGGLFVSHVLDPVAFAEDCRRADVIVTPLTAPADCRARLIIDGERLELFGSHAVRVGVGSGEPVFSVKTERSIAPRPWQRPSPPQ
ncbi:MAG: ComEC/Rec2 family competence protein [Propylenella sp.]